MLSPIQKEIVELPGNLIVRASAGTGKTHTMVSKIEYDIAHCHTHKAVAAITFTIKAAAEIKDRLTIDTSEEDVYNHYVAATRAKAKLILVYINGDYRASQFAKNINNILGKSGLKIKDIATVINCLDCLSN